ncbi:MAG: hypothetical protein KGJ06_05790 [Pseudomonadota bacterium]|nr:hypothetical protein [Pseudomonadota bacterium]
MAPAQKHYSIEDFQSRYLEITKLYDHAESLVGTVESDFVKDASAQLELVEPLISELGDATDVLAEEFLLIAEGKKRRGKSKASKSHIEGALRKIFTALHEYHARVQGAGRKARGAIQNIADPIVQKIQKQVEQVIIIFLEFVQISLHSIMGKMELEALKVRDPRIVALMMHQQAMQQQ